MFGRLVGDVSETFGDVWDTIGYEFRRRITVWETFGRLWLSFEDVTRCLGAV